MRSSDSRTPAARGGSGSPTAGWAPRVVAHRGASDDNAEHTLGAYVAALDAGADGVECDVRLTADGHLVCVHDRDLKRLANRRALVSTMSLEELAAIDVASWKRPWAELDDEALERDTDLDRVLTLRRLLETVADTGRPVEVAIETKHPTRYAGLVEKRLVETLRDFGWDRDDSPVRVMSFSHVALQRVERLAPGLPLVQLIERGQAWTMLRRVVRPHWAVGPGIRELREHRKLGRRIVEAGHELHAWVINDQDDLDLVRGLGAQVVITDRPAHVLGLLGRGPGAAPRPPSRQPDGR